jgi:hypothetical protein
MSDHRCDCGCNPPHATEAECRRNRAATKQYMDRMTGSQLDGHVARMRRDHPELFPTEAPKD